MKSCILAATLVLGSLGAGTALFAPPSALAQDDGEVSFTFFYDSLEPFGEWLEVADYGMCWRPSRVADDWAPYTDGYWSYTDAGWTWVSYEEDFGSIVYHYGRWVKVEDEGWCWVPDEEWGPAWVSWRKSDDYVGWAPLPPEAEWEPKVGFSTWVDTDYDIGPANYNFCRVEDIGAPLIAPCVIPRSRNITIIDNTVNITNISVNTYYSNDDYSTPLIHCGGPRYDIISLRSLRPVPTLKIVRNVNITNIYNPTIIQGEGGRRAASVRQVGNQLIFPAPRIKKIEKVFVDQTIKIRPERAGRVIAASRIKRGWDDVRVPEERERVREKFRKETEGRDRRNSPARAVQVADLAVLPEKSDPKAESPVNTARARKSKEDRSGRGGREREDKPVAGTTPAPRPGVIPPPNVAAEEDRPAPLDGRPDRTPRGTAAEAAPVPLQPVASPTPALTAKEALKEKARLTREAAAERTARGRSGRGTAEAAAPAVATPAPVAIDTAPPKAGKRERPELEAPRPAREPAVVVAPAGEPTGDARSAEREALAAERQRLQAEKAARQAAGAEVERGAKAADRQLMQAQQEGEQREATAAAAERQRRQGEKAAEQQAAINAERGAKATERLRMQAQQEGAQREASAAAAERQQAEGAAATRRKAQAADTMRQQREDDNSAAEMRQRAAGAAEARRQQAEAAGAQKETQRSQAAEAMRARQGQAQAAAAESRRAQQGEAQAAASAQKQAAMAEAKRAQAADANRQQAAEVQAQRAAQAQQAASSQRAAQSAAAQRSQQMQAQQAQQAAAAERSQQMQQAQQAAAAQRAQAAAQAAAQRAPAAAPAPAGEDPRSRRKKDKGDRE